MQDENAIATDVVDVAYKLHTKYGPGVYENVYEVTMAYELRKRGYQVERQVPQPIQHDEIIFDEAYRLDLLINNLLIVELKSLDQVLPCHKKQVQTYLKLSEKRLGLLINFGEELIKNGIVRVVNGLRDDALFSLPFSLFLLSALASWPLCA